MRVHMCVGFETALAPDGVIAAITDFSAKRPEIWRGLDPEKYAVIEVSEASALVREGSRRPNIWARERYDWSHAGTVSWTIEASNAFAPGTLIRLTATPSGRGSHVEIDGERVAATTIGYAVVVGLRLFGTRFLQSTYKATFDRIARTGM